MNKDDYSEDMESDESVKVPRQRVKSVPRGRKRDRESSDSVEDEPQIKRQRLEPPMSTQAKRKEIEECLRNISQGPKDLAFSNAILKVASELIDELTLELCFETHKKLKTGRLCQNCQRSRAVATVDENEYDVFGTNMTNFTPPQFVCQNGCNRTVIASRYAPHLEQCMGVGKARVRRKEQPSSYVTSYADSGSADDSDADGTYGEPKPPARNEMVIEKEETKKEERHETAKPLSVVMNPPHVDFSPSEESTETRSTNNALKEEQKFNSKIKHAPAMGRNAIANVTSSNINVTIKPKPTTNPLRTTSKGIISDTSSVSEDVSVKEEKQQRKVILKLPTPKTPAKNGTTAISKTTPEPTTKKPAAVRGAAKPRESKNFSGDSESSAEAESSEASDERPTKPKTSRRPKKEESLQMLINELKAKPRHELQGILSSKCGVISTKTHKMCSKTRKCPQHTAEAKAHIRKLLLGD